jgi:hypothetical protein
LKWIFEFLIDKKKNGRPFFFIVNDGWREEVIWRAEEEEEEGERRGYEGGCGGYGAFKAWTDEVVDGVGVAS